MRYGSFDTSKYGNTGSLVGITTFASFFFVLFLPCLSQVRRARGLNTFCACAGNRTLLTTYGVCMGVPDDEDVPLLGLPNGISMYCSLC